MSIRIYFHIATLHNWATVVKHIFEAIKTSGLLAASDDINISVLGDPEAVQRLLDHPKVKIRFHSPDTNLYERPILGIIRQDASEAQKPFNVLYIHSKGIRYHNQQNQCVKDWTDYLVYFNIEQWRLNQTALETYQTSGVNWQADPRPHYSGNFWWARSDYLAGLPAEIGPDYLEPEMWIGTNHPKFKCLFYSRINHYTTPFPQSLYRDHDK